MDWFIFSHLSIIMSKINSPFLLIFIFFPVMLPQSVNSSYPNCPSYNCNDVTISYPFWKLKTTESTSQFCGYQGFGINCSVINKTELPTINLAGNLYHVQKINYNISSISLVDSNIINLPTDCPRVRHAINLGTLPFEFSKFNVNLSFHFNCTGYPSFANPIPCVYDNESKASVNVLDPETEKFDWSVYSCDEEVVTTVLRDGINVSGFDQGIDYVRGLRRGFELKWFPVDDCRKCEESDGRCGRSNSTEEMMCFCSDGTSQCNKGRGNNSIVKVVIGVGVPLLSILLICTTCYFMKFSPITYLASVKLKRENDKIVESFVKQHGSLATKRYKYAEIKKITKSFQVQLGRGGFGTVYKGNLSDGQVVAVKVLNSSRSTVREFINKVASLVKISHSNIVSLLGFCLDNHKRVLVYEFIPNGSLDKFLHSRDCENPNMQLEVKKLYEVALGIARGLDHLHRGCDPRVLHLDLKPANILLDENFCPKIADFGLSKLYSRNESTVSMLEARGTIGYISPEVFNRNIGGVSHKSDVYSYGMLILEMIGANKDVSVGVGSKSTSDSYFPYWIYNRLEKEEYVIDDTISIEDNEHVRKMTIVGLWCIQPAPTQRPSIGEVIEMLEGSTNALEVPQKPSFSYPIQAPSCCTSQSEQDSSYLMSSYEF